MNDLFPINSDKIMEADRQESKAVAKLFPKKQADKEPIKSENQAKTEEKKACVVECVPGLFKMVNDRGEFFITPDNEPHVFAVTASRWSRCSSSLRAVSMLSLLPVKAA